MKEARALPLYEEDLLKLNEDSDKCSSSQRAKVEPVGSISMMTLHSLSRAQNEEL